MRKKIAIVHFQPLEFYPPVTNLIQILSEKNNLDLRVFSTFNNKARKPFNFGEVLICRYALSKSSISYLRLLYYFLFNLKTIFQLIRYRPHKVLYYESYSAYPVYFYKKYINKKVGVLMHSHEYFWPEWYENSMKLVRYYHQLEKEFLYPNCDWISQTNEDRKRLFLKDNLNLSDENVNVVPNYPLTKWIERIPKRQNKDPKQKVSRVVYLGAISFEKTYIKEFCDWVISQEGKVIFDIYSYNLSGELSLYLKDLDTDYITFIEGGIDYEDVPVVLSNYDCGVVLYKSFSLNMKYNIPNKVFEYLLIGLKVLYPKEMIAVNNFCLESSLNLEAIDFSDIKVDLDFKDGKELPISKYNAEFINTELLDSILG